MRVSPRRGPARPDLHQVRTHREAADPVAVRWGLRAVPAMATRGPLHRMWRDQTSRQPRRAGPPVLRAVRRPTEAALRAVRTDPADRPPRPRRNPRHLRRLLPDARSRLQAAAGGNGHVCSRPGRNRSASAAPQGPRRSARTAAPTGHRRRGGPRDRSATRVTTRRSAAAAPALPAGRSVGSSPHPARTRRPARTAPACPPPTPARTAGSRTNSTNKAAAHPARCAAGPVTCSAPAPNTSRPHSPRSTGRSPAPTPHAPR